MQRSDLRRMGITFEHVAQASLLNVELVQIIINNAGRHKKKAIKKSLADRTLNLK